MATTLFPRLTLLAAVSDAEARAAFAAAGMKPVVDDGLMPGPALAATVLAELDVAPERIEAWAARHRDRAVGRHPGALAVSG